MLFLNGVSAGSASVLLHGLDISQCPVHGETIFLNKTYGKLHVGLRLSGCPSIGFVLNPGENRKVENLEGEYDLSIVHICDVMDVTAIVSSNSITFLLVEGEFQCSGHAAKLKIEALEHSSTSVS